MSLNFFENAVTNGLAQLPNNEFRERQQAAIDQRWEVTTNRYVIQEQDEIGSIEYHDTEAWIGNAMGMTTRGMANGDDFKQLTFRSIDHKAIKGLYYKFDNNVWLTHFTDNNDAVDVTIGVRKCNNVMKIVDPENGSVFCIPCAVEYDMTAPNMQVTSAILTPNNHATVMVQGNDDTLRLFKTNTRYILGGRPFKLLGMQNAIIDKRLGLQDTLLYFDLFLDERHAKDDVDNQLADNGDYHYTVEIDSNNLDVAEDSIGSLEASVTLNGQEVNREIEWESLSPTVVQIDADGNYKVVGKDGNVAIIVARLKGNADVIDSVKLNITGVGSIVPKIIIDPSFDKIRQFESIGFEVLVNYGGTIYKADTAELEASDNLFVNASGDNYIVTGEEIGDGFINVKIQDQAVEQKFPVRVTSMFG